MHPQIESEIKKFEALLAKYADVGGLDSEPAAQFQLLIARAICKEPLNFSQNLDWDLLFDSEADDASVGERVQAGLAELTQQGELVFAAVQTHATPEDEQELRKYCWRIDKEEFLSWEQIGALSPLFKK